MPPPTARRGFALALPLLALLSAGTLIADARSPHVRTVRSGSPEDALVSPPDARPRHHVAGELDCTECHAAHGEGAAAAVRVGSRTPTPMATANHDLRAEDPLDPCLACHDGVAGIPDVVGEDVNGLEGRSAGFFLAPGVRNPNGHDLGRGLGSQAGTPALCARCHPGARSAARVTCVDCHDPHGNGRSRNLRWASDPAGTPILGLFVQPLARGLDRYESRNVAFGTLDSDQLREASSICVDCHHDMSGLDHVDVDRNGIHERHPTYDSEHRSRNSIRQGAAKGSSDPRHWERGEGSGFAGATRLRFVTAGAGSYGAARVVNAAANGVFCLTCHRAHGSDQPFALAWTVSRDNGPAGCDQCHATTEVASYTSR